MAEPPPPPQEQPEQQSQDQLQLTVLYGSHSASSAVCYLLEISGVRILLDCGWDSNYDPALLEPLERIADKIQLILISHADLEHMGALAYAYKNFALRAQCWCTKPVLKFGHMNLYDSVLNGAGPFTLDDVDRAMAMCKECAFQQELKVRHGEGEGQILITPRAAGRSLGGAIWSLVNDESSVAVQYASDTNLRRETLLDGMDVGSLARDPTLLILDCLGASASAATKPQPQPQQGGESKDRLLVRALEDALKRGGDVLIPVPCTSRVVEVLLVLNAEWQRNPTLRQFDLVFLTRVSSILGVAENHVEWLSRRLQEVDVTLKDSPLRFANVQVVNSFEDAFPVVPAAGAGGRAGAAGGRVPRVVVCGGADLEPSSFSREAFVREFAPHTNSLVMLLFSSYIKSSVAGQLLRKDRQVEMEEDRWVDLEGDELVEWKRKRDAAQEERLREQENEVELEKFESMGEQDADGVSGGDVDMEQRRTVTINPLLSKRHTSAAAAAADRSLFKDAHDKDESFTFVPLIADDDAANAWDEYGAVFDAKGLMLRRTAGGGEGEVARSPSPPPHQPQQAKAKLAKLASSSATDEPDLLPRKRVRHRVVQPVSCHVAFVDFDGRNTRSDLLEIVHQIKPKKLAVVRCGMREAEAFGQDCQSRASCGVALNPPPGETLDVAADSSVVKVRIPDETLQTSPPAVSFGGFTIQRIRGKMQLMNALASAAANKQQQQQQHEKRRRLLVTAGGELPSIVSLREGGDDVIESSPAAAASATTATSGEEYAWVSKTKEPDLTFVLKKLKLNNIPVALVSSVLLCGHGHEVQVWKPAEGRMLVSGPLCDLYFETRKLVYSCYALV